MKVNPTPAKLSAFRQWLLESGRSDGTASEYVGGVRRAAAHADGIAGRLTSRLAPNTLHADRAALRSYATYTEDGDLLVQVKKIRLPPARRVTPKVELAYDVWRHLVRAITADKKAKPVVRAVLLIMALRGLRVGDALRLTPKQIELALETGRLVFEAKGRRRLDYAATTIAQQLEAILAIDAHWSTLGELVCRRKTGAIANKSARGHVLRELKRIAASINVADVYNHRLRRTYATHYVRQLKGDPQAIMKLQSHMGWASPTTAMAYVDAVNTDELDKLGESLIGDLLEEPPAPKKRKR